MRKLSRRFSLVTAAAVVALALSVAGCSAGLGEITGGSGGTGSGSQSGADNGTSESGADDDSANDDNGNADPNDPNDANAADAPSVGTIEVKVERLGASPRMFTLQASECEASVDRVRVIGVGSEDGTGIGVEIEVDTTLREVLHERTRTYSAAGHITLRVADGATWVSDGRLTTNSHPSMFEYRIEDNYAEFRTAWFGTPSDTAGFVHAWCD